MTDQTLQNGFLAQLEKQLAEAHDASEHKFTPREDDPAVCAVCCWINPEGKKHDCGHTTREHALALLEKLKSGELRIGEPVVMEIHIIQRRRRNFWDLFR